MAETLLRVRLTPRSSRNEIVRVEADVLHARVTAPPVDGAANCALLELLAKALNVHKTALSIQSGKTSREKRVRIEGLAEAEVQKRLRKR